MSGTIEKIDNWSLFPIYEAFFWALSLDGSTFHFISVYLFSKDLFMLGSYVD